MSVLSSDAGDKLPTIPVPFPAFRDAREEGRMRSKCDADVER